MTVSFRPAVRENVGLLIGLAGASGSGKTYTAMRLASGMTPPGKRFAVIDTENGRASHYADQFSFDVAELHAPFTPARYAEAIEAADKAGYAVIVVDSMSHEYAGEGGILDMQEAEFAKAGYKDSAKMLSWVKPKGEHKRMMNKLLQTKAHLILCLRAEAKIEMVKVDGKTQIVPKQSLVGLDGWIPVTEKTLPFELTVSLLLTPDKPGIPHPIKLQQQHRAMFPLDKEINEESGRRILEWARGGAAMEKGTVLGVTIHEGQNPGIVVGANLHYITGQQAIDLEVVCRDNEIPVKNLVAAAKVTGLDRILVADLPRALSWIDAAIAKRKGASDAQA